MSKNVTMKIAVPSLAVRTSWTSLADTGWSDDVLFEIVQRYCDSQDHAKNYRQRAALKMKIMKSKLAAVEALAAAANMSVEEYLEIETSNSQENG